VGSATGTLVPGAVVAGRYEVQALLGQGGMGVVYQAHDRLLSETVALKVLRAETVSEEAALRFREEIRLARRVSHRNVCRIHEYGETDGLRFISMAFVDGVDLKRILRRDGRLPEAEAFAAAEAVAAGLQAIHEEGIVHRDLKTANIMRDGRGVVRLMDFGIAKDGAAGTAAGLTATGLIVGTPEYMSPEQAMGARVDARADLYAFGIVVYELFTGRVPFRADTPMAVILQHITEPPPLEGPDAADLPGALRPLLARALAKDPNARFASAREMGDALRAAALPDQPTLLERTAVLPRPASTRTVPAAPAPRPRRAPPRPRRWALPLLLGLGLAALAVLAGALVAWRMSRRPAPVAAVAEPPPPSAVSAVTAAPAARVPDTAPPSPGGSAPAPAPSPSLAPVAPAAVRPATAPLPRRDAPAPGVAAPEAAPAARAASAVDAAWTEAQRLAGEATRPPAERSAALQQFLQRYPDANPHRAEAERLLKELESAAARALAAAPPDRSALGRLRRAIYVGGTLSSLRDGTEGNLSFADRARLLFLAAEGGAYVPVPYTGISGLDYGLTVKTRLAQPIGKKKSHFLTVHYADPAGERQALVLELGGDDLRPVLALLEARSGVKVTYQDEKAAAERWK